MEKCTGYTTCTECVGSNGDTDGDPYCGWCTLENRLVGMNDNTPKAQLVLNVLDPMETQMETRIVDGVHWRTGYLI